MSFKQILDNVSNIEDLDNVTILKTLQKFSEAIKDFAEQQSGLQNLINVEFMPTENSVTYADGVVDYLGELKITLADNIIVNKPCSVKFNIKGSETIVVDVDEFDNALEIHLDSDIIHKIDRALLLPLTPPTTSKLVGVDQTNSQNLLNVGTNLLIEDDTLKLDDDFAYKVKYSQNYTEKTNTITTFNEHPDSTSKYPSNQVLFDMSRGYNNFRMDSFSDLNDLQDWIKNTAPAGCYTKYCNIGGSITGAIICKVSSQYSAYIRFGYGMGHVVLNRLSAGNWVGETNI